MGNMPVNSLSESNLARYKRIRQYNSEIKAGINNVMFWALNNQSGKKVKIFLATLLAGLHNKKWLYNTQNSDDYFKATVSLQAYLFSLGMSLLQV